MASAKAAASKATGTGGARIAAKIGAIDLTGRVSVTELRKPLYPSSIGPARRAIPAGSGSRHARSQTHRCASRRRPAHGGRAPSCRRG